MICYVILNCTYISKSWLFLLIYIGLRYMRLRTRKTDKVRTPTLFYCLTVCFIVERSASPLAPALSPWSWINKGLSSSRNHLADEISVFKFKPSSPQLHPVNLEHRLLKQQNQPKTVSPWKFKFYTSLKLNIWRDCPPLA